MGSEEIPHEDEAAPEVKNRVIPAVGLVLLTTCLAWADFKAGVESYERGDYVIVPKEFRPLSQEGDADAQDNLGVAYGLPPVVVPS